MRRATPLLRSYLLPWTMCSQHPRHGRLPLCHTTSAAYRATPLTGALVPCCPSTSPWAWSRSVYQVQGWGGGSGCRRVCLIAGVGYRS